MASRYEGTPKSDAEATSRSLCDRINSRKRGGCQLRGAAAGSTIITMATGGRTALVRLHHFGANENPTGALYVCGWL